MGRLIIALVVLLASSSVIISNAFYQKKQFYPSVVYLIKYRPFFAIILIQSLLFLLLFAKFICWVFFGTLQRIELDNILSRTWQTFFDMCLVFAFFQDELNLKYMLLFVIVVFVKAFHWLLEERIDQMERNRSISLNFHVKMTVFICILTMVDFYYISNFYWNTSSEFLASLTVGAEYYILIFGLLSTTMRYILQTINSFRDTHWDQKTMYMQYIDIFVGLLRLSFYLEFVPLLWSRHPFPLFIIRPIFLNLRFLQKAIRGLILSRHAINLMNNVFQDVTVAELAALTDTVCIICREEMERPVNTNENSQPSSSTVPPADSSSTRSTANNARTTTTALVKRLPCSHIFHASCLRSWFQRQQTCPTCRMQINRRNPQVHAQQRPAATQPPPTSSPSTTQNSTSATRSTNPTHVSANISSFNNLSTTLPFAHPTISGQSTIPGSITGMPFNLPNSFAMPPVIIPGNLLFPTLNSPMPIPPNSLSSEIFDEATLRKSVESRITALRHIHTLLDAAILQMNTYLLAVSNPSSPDNTTAEKTDSFLQKMKTKETTSDENQSASLENDNIIDLESLRKSRLEKLSKDSEDVNKS